MGSRSRSGAARSKVRGTRLAIGIITLATLVGGLPTAALCADPLLPPAIQAAMTVKMLEYDRSLKTWAGGRLTVGIITKAGGASASEFSQALTGRDAQGVPLKPLEYVYRDADSLTRWIESNGVRLAYLSPDLSGETAATILSALAPRKLPTLTATRAQFQNGATLGIVVKEGKPHILVGLAASRAAGMDLDPKLLQLAEVVR
jgi:hypothetical protein